MKKKRMRIRDKKKFIRAVSVCVILIIAIVVIIINTINRNNKKTQETSSEISGNVIGDANTVNLDSWNLILVNKDNYLPDDFEVKLKTLTNGHQIDERIYPDLQKMMDDAREEGLEPIICSSYRTIEEQNKLFNNKIEEYMNKGYSKGEAKKETEMWVAIPGTSEHHTGLAIDIVSSEYQTLDKEQEETKEQKWLIENAYKYGFILRYPTDKSEITGINYEPWHYRYVGIEDAKKIKEQGVTLEEYLRQ